MAASKSTRRKRNLRVPRRPFKAGRIEELPLTHPQQMPTLLSADNLLDLSWRLYIVQAVLTRMCGESRDNSTRGALTRAAEALTAAKLTLVEVEPAVGRSEKLAQLRRPPYLRLVVDNTPSA